MTIKRYRFKRFFNERLFHSGDWFSNAHFVADKSILTPKQREFINEAPIADDKILKLMMEVIRDAKKWFKYSRKVEFIPTKAREYDEFVAVCNDAFNLFINEEYYTFFTRRGCKIYKGKDILSPAIVCNKDNEFTGVLFPIRCNINGFKKEMIKYH